MYDFGPSIYYTCDYKSRKEEIKTPARTTALCVTILAELFAPVESAVPVIAFDAPTAVLVCMLNAPD